MDLVIFLHAPFVEFRFSRVPLYLTVLYSGVRRKFQFNGYNSIFLAYTNVCSVTSRGGRGGTPIYWLYRYVPVERVWFSSYLLWDTV